MSRSFTRTVAVLAVSVLTIVIFAGSYAYAQEMKALVEQAKARHELYEKKIKDMTIDQEMTFVTPEGTMTADTKMMKKGERFRMETAIEIPESAGMPVEMREMMGGTIDVITIYDGTETWAFHPFTGKIKLGGAEEKKYQMLRDWWGMLPPDARVTGTEKVAGRECHIIEMEESSDIPFTRMWLDKKELVLVKGEGTSNGETYTMTSSDFKTIGDTQIAMPYKTEISRNGKTEMTITVKSLEVNTGLGDDLFDPAKVKQKESGMQDMIKRMMRQGDS